ncbi:hypothetical protein [Salipaludibacillus sp. CF4.18]|uniref:hypothetical protein n=1 Tax=Salipaludibacillus sp. CF4.18 TaxID=3373081 RepID=UPI003EE7C65C
MIKIELLERSYPFQSIRWMIEGKIMDTNKGMKAVQLWKEEDLLAWHIKWRDALAEHTGIMTNRMIQTITGEKVLSTDLGFITVHDVVEEAFPIFDHPKQIGQFLGEYLACTAAEEDDREVPIIPDLERDFDIHFFEELSQWDILQKLNLEAKKRVTKVRELLKNHSHIFYHNIVPPIESLIQARSVHHKLFWETSEKKPISCYEALRNVLHEWHTEGHGAKIKEVLDGIDETFPLSEERGTALLANCLYPWELRSFVANALDNDGTGTMEQHFQSFAQEWDISRRLVKDVAGWLVNSREGVVQ